MPLVRAMRLFNALEAGALSGTQLQTLLTADPARVGELSVMFGMRGQSRRMAASSTSFGALLGGTAALNALVSNQVFMSEVEASPAAMRLLLANSVVSAKLLAVYSGLDPALYTTATAVLAAATPTQKAVSTLVSADALFLAMLKSGSYMSAVDSSAAFRASVYGAPLAGGYFGCVNVVGANRFAVVQAPKAAGESGGGIAWKTSNDDSPNTAGNDDGLANANAQNNATHPLFQWARGLSIGGFTDWAPPAYNVIQAIVAKLRPAVADNALFKAGGAQAYETASTPQYWSATQHPSSTDNAWCSSFSDGSSSTNNKSHAYRARVVRRINL